MFSLEGAGCTSCSRPAGGPASVSGTEQLDRPLPYTAALLSDWSAGHTEKTHKSKETASTPRPACSSSGPVLALLWSHSNPVLLLFWYHLLWSCSGPVGQGLPACLSRSHWTLWLIFPSPPTDVAHVRLLRCDWTVRHLRLDVSVGTLLMDYFLHVSLRWVTLPNTLLPSVSPGSSRKW